MDLRTMIGRRIEIPVHTNMWMRGARFGVITSFRHGGAGQSDYVRVRMDHPEVTQLFKVWRPDWEYVKVVD